MKKTILTLAALAGIASFAQAQLQFVAAWDFTSPSGFTSLDVNDDFAAETELAADYAGSGLFQWANVTEDTSGFYSAHWNDVNSADIFADNSGLTQLGDGTGFRVVANPDTNAILTFTGLDFSGLSGANLDFAAGVQNFDGLTTLNFGGDLSGSIDLSGTGTAYNVDLSALEGNSNATFTIQFSNFSGNENVVLDNFQFTGTAVPEPSAFAAIFGAIAMGVAATRRRARK
ncbi:PEP-CTERM sorting domain-containing protein [Coraliomargarita algicola]|uniref:PEP-CTERM sorting domain-containing protein n=1 Tax=Coraliomargarita algicola TaxID=3092156 RepID=A0ABZ0RHD4_9BACT|nr:PEP-CTERM sorting domain-containing protein [Coraliomargarita sp. J2-16]WPJ94190.1 PEP-CTERM sorting domain-containing protein [Coraliomargarita sp. J2-16]